MIAIQYGTGSNRRLDFWNKFEELPISAFVDFLKKEVVVQKIQDEIKCIRDDMERVEEDDVESVVFLENLFFEKAARLNIAFCGMLAALSPDKEAFETLTETPGITPAVLIETFEAINARLGDFQAFFDKTKATSTFKFKDYKKRLLGRDTKFIVQPLSRQTVLRDAAANVVADKIANIESEFSAANFESLARFVAYVARPENEEEEYLPNVKKVFIGGKSFERLSAEDRLSAYNEKLRETVELRTEVFEALPLSVALGVWKYWFLQKKNFRTPIRKFSRKTKN